MTWANVSIGSVCLPTSQRDPRLSPDDEFAYLDIASINREQKTFEQPQYIIGKDAPSRARKVVRVGDVLVSTVRPNLNAVAQVDEVLDDQIASTGFCVLRANPRLVLSRYLYYRVTTTDFIEFLVARMRGANYPAVTDGVVKEAPIPLPPLSEQRRIVEILDKADALRRRRAEADAKAARILPALFIKMFGDPATNPRGWDTPRLSEIGEIITGNTPPRSDLANYGNYIEWIKTDNLNGILGTVTPSKEYLSKQGVKIGRTAPAGSTLIACIAGSHESIGRSALLDRKAAFNQQINAVTPFPDIDPYFLYGTISVSKPAIQLLSTKAMKGLVSKSQLEGLRIVCPPKELRDAFASKVQTILDLRRNQYQLQEDVDYAFSLLLRRAFSGDLTARWREAHMHELLAEMEQQARWLGLGGATTVSNGVEHLAPDSYQQERLPC